MADASPLLFVQRTTPPDQKVQAEIGRRLNPRPGERWLDFDCGPGAMTALLWRLSSGQLAEILAVDRAPVFAENLDRLTRQLQPPPSAHQIRFQAGNSLRSVQQLPDAHFDGIVAGFSLAFIENSPARAAYYADADYSAILAECHRILKPGGRFVFAVHIPEPGIQPLFRQAAQALPPQQALFDALFHQRYRHWLRRKAKRGRFHFLSPAEIGERLRVAGFIDWEKQPSAVDGSYIICARTELLVSRRAA